MTASRSRKSGSSAASKRASSAGASPLLSGKSVEDRAILLAHAIADLAHSTTVLVVALRRTMAGRTRGRRPVILRLPHVLRLSRRPRLARGRGSTSGRGESAVHHDLHVLR